MPTWTTASITNPNVILSMFDINAQFEVIIDSTMGSVTIAESTYDNTVTANEGFIIEGVTVRNDSGTFFDFLISADGKTATLDNHIVDYVFTPYITTEIPVPPSNVTGFNHVYLVDGTILTEISKIRFGSSTETIDLGEYIINVLELPFPISPDIKGIDSKIEFGPNIVETTAIALNNDELNISLGEIIIPNKYSNSYDYLNTNVFLHLPFSDKIELDVNYSIGEIIKLNYIVNLYTGETTINIISSKLNDEAIYSEKIKIGKNIPFVKKQGGVYGTSNQINLTALNNQVFNPFIEVIRNKPHEINSVFNTDMLKQTKLINEIGFIGVSNVILNTEATLQEKNNIVSLLKSGVFIK